MLKRFVCLCALFVVCGSAQATTIWTGTNFRIDASAPVAVGIALEGVTLTAVGLSGALPKGFEGTGGGLTGITTAGSELHQIWIAGIVHTPTLDNLNGTTMPIDSHFLVTTGGIISGSAPDENRTIIDATENADGGYGSFLTGSFAPIGTPTSTWDFAYLAVPLGTTITLNFNIVDGNEGEATRPTEHVTGSFVVPEPASVTLLATAALALALSFLVRRRSS